MSLFIVLFILYSLAMILVGLQRKNRISLDETTVFFGNRPLSIVPLTLTVTASWFGAATLLVTFNESASNGFSSLWTLGAPTLITLALFIAFTPRIRALGHTSMSHFFNTRFSPAIAAFVTLVIGAYMILFAASQFSAWGQIAPLFGIEAESAIVVGTLSVLLYSAFGGFRSVIRTDRVQFVLLSLAVLMLLAGALFYSPAPTVRSSDFDMSRNLPRHLAATLGFVMAWTISPIIWQRIAASRSIRTARIGLSLSMVLYFFLIFTIAWAAICWRPLLDPGQPPLLSIRQHTPPWMGAIIELGLAAAIMSTADTALNTGALALQPFGKGRFALWARLNLRGAGICLLGIPALWIALRHQSILKLLGLAGELMSCALFVPGLYALIKGKGPTIAAAFSLLMGGGFAFLSFTMQTAHLPGTSFWPDWPYSSLIGIALSVIGFGAGLIWSRRLSRR